MPRQPKVIWFDDRSAHIDRFGLLLTLTALAIVALALVDLDKSFGTAAGVAASVVTTVIVGGTLLLALRASGLARKWLRLADAMIGLVVVVIVLVIIADFVMDLPLAPAESGTHPLSLLVLSALAPVVVVRRLLQHRRVTTGTLLGAISAFLLIPIAFCYAFIAIDTFQSTPFFGQVEPTTSYMHFSLSTLTTVGYGDLVAITPLARLVADSEAVVGQVYLVTFVAMLVGLRAQRWAAGRRDEPTQETSRDN